MNPIIQISTTSDQRDELDQLANDLLKNKLAACCQISGPIASRFLWKGKLESSEEWTCTIKTERRLYSSVEARIRELHHYDEPEIIAVEIVDASAGYEKWIRESVRQTNASD